MGGLTEKKGRKVGRAGKVVFKGTGGRPRGTDGKCAVPRRSLRREVGETTEKNGRKVSRDGKVVFQRTAVKIGREVDRTGKVAQSDAGAEAGEPSEGGRRKRIVPLKSIE